MINKSCRNLLFLSFLILSSVIYAQTDSILVSEKNVYRIFLNDGSLFIGKILSENDSIIYFKTLSKIDVRIPVDQIKKREIATRGNKEGEYWRNDPNKTRLLFSPTGRALKAGQGYISVTEIFFPFFAIGITDFLSIGGGISLFPGANTQILYIAPKITPIHLDKFDISGGVLYINVPGEVDNAGVAYGISTYGTEKAAVTFGLGWGFSGDDFSNNPVILIGGEIRTSNSVKLITENWILPDTDVSLISFGIRSFGENIAADFGLIFPAGADIKGFPFFPWVGFAYNFGKNR